ncbi:MAG TPA: Maf family protein [Negativicutes bacterium]|jgi:septum formation protein
MAIILASASPRRQQLLQQVGCQFTVITSDVMEDNQQKMQPVNLAVSQAEAKALAVANQVSPEDVVIGADTIVVLQGKVYGKPADTLEAYYMLSCLSGKEHEVITGVAVVHGADLWTDSAITRVRFANLLPEEIERYVATGEPMDKAGAYAIQGKGSLLVESISGCYDNVVGLPLVVLAAMLKKAGISLL